MLELLRNPVFVVFAALTICGIVPVLAHYWYKVRRAELDASLKHDMLQRGMSADEIERVLQAPAGPHRCYGRKSLRAAGLHWMKENP